MKQYEYYKIYNIDNKEQVNNIISLFELPLNCSSLRIELDYLEEKAIVYTDDVLIPIDYEKTKELLTAYL